MLSSSTFKAVKFAKKYVGLLHRPSSDDEEDSSCDKSSSGSDDEDLLNDGRVYDEEVGLVLENEQDTKRVYNKLDSATRKRLLEILSSQVESQHRKTSATAKDGVVGWCNNLMLFEIMGFIRH